jgi:hypothetical protein
MKELKVWRLIENAMQTIIMAAGEDCRFPGVVAVFGLFSSHLSGVESIGTERAGAIGAQVIFDIDDVRPGSTHPHNVKTFTGQVVARDEGNLFTLGPVANTTALSLQDEQRHR